MRLPRIAAIGLLLLTPASLRVMAQMSINPRAESDDQARQERLLLIQRRKRAIADSQRVLKLAADLKHEINAASPSTLSAASYNKAAEIEKLAHDISQQAKN